MPRQAKPFLHTDRDACWKVQRALDEQGIAYDVVKHGYGKGRLKRTEILMIPRSEDESGSADAEKGVEA